MFSPSGERNRLWLSCLCSPPQVNVADFGYPVYVLPLNVADLGYPVYVLPLNVADFGSPVYAIWFSCSQDFV